MAVNMAHRLFTQVDLHLIYIDVFDRSELEGKFLSGDLDLILNDRFPSPTKPRYSQVIGYQALNHLDSNSSFPLFSSFEFNVRGRHKSQSKETRALVSNSLYVRKLWFEKFGGSGLMPSALFDKPKKGHEEVYLIGGDWLDPHVWTALQNR